MRVWDFSDPALRKLRKKIAMIPVGSLEQHGAHLPVSTDSDIVSHIADRVAERCGLLLFPTISYGVSFEHAPLFNLSVTPATLRRLLVEACVSLGENGICRIVILNGHHGNQRALDGVAAAVSRASRRRVRVFALSYWKFMGVEFDHAGFVETSLMLACSKKVRMGLAKKGLDPARLDKKQRARISKMAQKEFVRATRGGIWGDPTRATRRDGQRLITEIVRNLAETVSKLA